MKTWKLEMLVVAALLCAVLLVTKKLFSFEVLASLAVLLSFGHTQISDRLAEKEGTKLVPEVSCYKKLWWYFAGKEILWLLYFFLIHSYSALVGVFIFLAYPAWRSIYRTKIKHVSSN